MYRAFVGVGSNIEPARHVTAAVRFLARFSRVTGISTFYETPALRRPADRPFVNGVVALETALSPPLVRVGLLARVERWLGRERGADPYAPRTIDLDLLLLKGPAPNDEPIAPPHPDIRERAFVAAPLLELAGDARLAPWQERLGEISARLPTRDLRPLPALTTELRQRFLEHTTEDPLPWNPRPAFSSPGTRPRPPTPSAWRGPRDTGSGPAST